MKINETPLSISPNLSHGEQTALKELMNDKDIVIKPADKGSGLVIQDADKYTNEILSQLSNERFLKK